MVVIELLNPKYNEASLALAMKGLKVCSLYLKPAFSYNHHCYNYNTCMYLATYSNLGME